MTTRGRIPATSLYAVELQHESGRLVLYTLADNRDSAAQAVLEAEHIPPGALRAVYPVPQPPGAATAD